MAIAAFVLALVGVLVAGASLAWQVYSWGHDGPKVTVKTSFGYPVYGPDLGEQHYIVTAINLGRSPLAISSWGYELPNGHTLIVPDQLSWSTQLPHTLEGGHEASFHTPAASILRAVAVGTALKPFVLTPIGRIYAPAIKPG